MYPCGQRSIVRAGVYGSRIGASRRPGRQPRGSRSNQSFAVACFARATTAAMAAIAPLRPRVNAFFEHVTVNVDDKAVRANRLKLLNEIREATRAVADFSRIEG